MSCHGQRHLPLSPSPIQPGLGHFQGREAGNSPAQPELVCSPCCDSMFLFPSHPTPARCSRPKAVANAHIDAGNRTELNSRLRYACNPGYKRKAGTSSLIQCILWNGSEPRWTHPTLQCIRDPALSWETPALESTTQRGTTGATPNSSPSPASSQSPVPAAADGLSPDGSRPAEMVPTLDTPRLGEGTTPLPIPPTDYAAVSIQSVVSSVGLLVLLATGTAAVCCWRRRRRKFTRQGYTVTEPDIPMEGIPSGNEEVAPPAIVPTG
ncbi:interleukin-15 receptor subunit alpha isoform X2 [Passer montanus]|uniref:interleukin-15 receptor subunit alpha isoform X2 n=1 Tax=Passer montanus TaxID=9160 RepID=UPI00196141F6|nr:interleukin-15 receptor subunit alpha isoform X2 [Passer montanus]